MHNKRCSLSGVVPVLALIFAAACAGQTITIANPTPGATISGISTLFTATIVSAPSVVRVVWQVDAYSAYNPGIDGPTTVGNSVSAPFSYNFNSYWYLNGPHQVIATMYDATGAVVGSPSAAVSFVTANNYPVLWGPGMTVTVSGTSCTATAMTGACAIAYSITGSGVGTDQFGGQILVDGIGVANTTTGTNNFPQSATFYSQQFFNGPHVVCLVAIDNTASSSPIAPNGYALSTAGVSLVGTDFRGFSNEWCSQITFSNGTTPMSVLVSSSRVFITPGGTAGGDCGSSSGSGLGSCTITAQILNTDQTTSTCPSPVFMLISQAVNGTYNGVYLGGNNRSGASLQSPGNLLNGVASVSSSGVVTGLSLGAALVNVMCPTGGTISDLTVNGTFGAGGAFGNVKSATHSFTTANNGQLLNVTAGTNWVPGVYQFTTVTSAGVAQPLPNPVLPAAVTVGSSLGTATTGPTRQVWVMVTPGGNATPSPCYLSTGGVSAVPDPNCIWLSTVFEGFNAMQNAAPYGAGLVSPLTANGAGFANDFYPGFNTLQFSSIPTPLTGAETAMQFTTTLNNWLTGTVEGTNGLPLNPNVKGLAWSSSNLMGCPTQYWALGYGSESAPGFIGGTQTGIQYAITQMQSQGNILGMGSVDEINGNCGNNPLQGPLTLSNAGTNQSALTSVIASGGGVCSIALNRSNGVSLAVGQFAITGSNGSADPSGLLNSVAPAVYTQNGSGSGPSGGSIQVTSDGMGGLTVGTVTPGTNYWVAPNCRLSGGGGTYTSCTTTVDGSGHLLNAVITGATGFWTGPISNVLTLDTTNAINFPCPGVVSPQTYTAANDPGFNLEPFGTGWLAGNTQLMYYDSLAKIQTQINAVPSRHFFIQNPPTGQGGPVAQANWNGSPNYPGTQAIAGINSLADSIDLYISYGPGTYLTSRQPASGLMDTFEQGYQIPSEWGGWNPTKPMISITQASSTYSALAGTLANVGSCSGDTCTFSSPHGVASVIPGITRLSITGGTDAGGATDTVNNSFLVLAAPTPTTLKLLLAAPDFSCSGGSFQCTGTPTVLTQDGGTITNANAFFARGVPNVIAGNNTVSAGVSVGYLIGDELGISAWSALNNRKRGQTFTMTGISGSTPTSSCLISLNCTPSAATFVLLPENMNLSSAPLPTSIGLAYQQVPSLSCTSCGTAQIVNDFVFKKGITAGDPQNDENPGFAFGSCMIVVLERGMGQNAYKIMNDWNGYSDQYGFMAGINNPNSVYRTQFPGTLIAGKTQNYITPHGENNAAIPMFHALGNCGQMAQSKIKYLAQPSLNAPDCGPAINCEARAGSGSVGPALLGLNVTDGPQSWVFNTTPYLQSGQSFYCQIVNAVYIGPMTIYASGTSTVTYTLQPEDSLWCMFPKTFAGELTQPSVSFKLADVSGATSVSSQCGYDLYNLNNTPFVSLGSGSGGIVTSTLAYDKTIGQPYCNFYYLGSGNKPLSIARAIQP
jgi:hypothetical protein